jgi:serine/threonine protein kinase
MNVIHRDLKPENIVFMDREDFSTIKLIDFGLAVKYTKQSI